MTTDTLELPKPDLRVSAFGELEPTNGRSFVMGDFYTADQLRAYATAAVLAERKRIEQSPVVQFLFGADDLDGVGFSEVPPGKPRFWWRSLLRSAIRNKE